VIKRIVIAHTGRTIVANYKPEEVEEITGQRKPNVKYLSEFKVEKNMNTCIMVSKGGLILRDCLISMRILPRNLNDKLPAMVALPGTRCNMVNVDF
jgi:hypothetical protein